MDAKHFLKLTTVQNQRTKMKMKQKAMQKFFKAQKQLKKHQSSIING